MLPTDDGMGDKILPQTPVLKPNSLLFEFNHAGDNILPLTPSGKTLPSACDSPYQGKTTITPDPSSQLSTPHHTSRSSLESGAGGATHSSIDQYVENEMDGKIFIDVKDFAKRFVLPTSETGVELIDRLVEKVCEMVKGSADWKMPRGYSDSVYLPWVVKRMREVCKYAEQILQSESGGLEAKLMALNIDEQPLAAQWQGFLRNRQWAVKPGDMKGSVATRALDVVLAASPMTERWDMALVVGEYKSTAALGKKRKAIAQLAGYAGELFGVQAFRQFMPGFTLLQDKLQLWMCDRMGCSGSEQFSISTNTEHSRQGFVKTILAFTVMDYSALGFDSNVYSDPACIQMWTPVSAMSLGVLGYLKIKDETFCLRKLLFIRPGLACRGTRCFSVTSDSSQTTNELPELIVKTSWRFEDLVPEGANLEAIRKNSKVVNVVRLHAYDDMCNIEKDIRRGPQEGQLFPLKDPPKDHFQELRICESDTRTRGSRNRVFTRTALKDSGRPLIEARSALELLKGVYGAFLGHGTLYLHHRILHRDISRSNILLRPIDDDIRANDGFLIDLDYAVTVEAENLECKSSGAPHRTGTLPYMAIDILRNKYRSHLYHYDVESFFYVLIWSCLYNADDKGYVPPTLGADASARFRAACILTDKVTADKSDLLDPLTTWRKGALETIGRNKQLMIHECFDGILGLLRPGFNSNAVVRLLSQMQKMIFGEDGRLPSYRMARGWDIDTRKKDEQALYDDVRKAMEDAIAQLETE